jgi:hypothetical protein
MVNTRLYVIESSHYILRGSRSDDAHTFDGRTCNIWNQRTCCFKVNKSIRSNCCVCTYCDGHTLQSTSQLSIINWDTASATLKTWNRSLFDFKQMHAGSCFPDAASIALTVNISKGYFVHTNKHSGAVRSYQACMICHPSWILNSWQSSWETLSPDIPPRCTSRLTRRRRSKTQ